MTDFYSQKALKGEEGKTPSDPPAPTLPVALPQGTAPWIVTDSGRPLGSFQDREDQISTAARNAGGGHFCSQIEHLQFISKTGPLGPPLISMQMKSKSGPA